MAKDTRVRECMAYGKDVMGNNFTLGGVNSMQETTAWIYFTSDFVATLNRDAIGIMSIGIGYMEYRWYGNIGAGIEHGGMCFLTVINGIANSYNNIATI